MDLLGQLTVVLFLPEDISLVSGSPGGRRRHLDSMLCQIDPAYCRSLSRYNQVVTQRNALLRDLRERGGDPGQLAFWDERLVEHGAAIVNRRWQALRVLDELSGAIHGELTDSTERLHLRYVPSVETDGPEPVEAIAAAFQTQLLSLRSREVPAGMTLIGPHRDEVRFVVNGSDAGIYGSRGQQRTAALALKLAEVDLMHRETGHRPLLLLDDVLSELDARRRRFLVEWLSSENGPEQAVVTTTNLHALPQAFAQACQLWRVEMGQLSALDGQEVSA
jgi:DNA replication and repair protein RecF